MTSSSCTCTSLLKSKCRLPLVIIPREARGYSVELFGLSVRPSVPPLEGSIASRLRPHLYHRTTMIHAFLESPSNLDVYPRISFSIFEIILPELASKSTLYGYVMLTKGSIALRLLANYWPYSNDLYIFGKPNQPRCVHPRKRFALFGQNCRNWRRRSRHPKQRKSCWWQLFCFFFKLFGM